MLRKQQVYLFVFIAVVGVKCNIYSNFDLFQRPIDSWNWNDNRNLARQSIDKQDRDREELSPDFKDPNPSASEQKPILEPKPHPPVTTFNPVIPGGVVDVDGGGFQSHPFAEFDIPGFSFNRKPGIFSFGGFFGSDLGQWWKGPNVCIEREESTDDEDDESDEESIEDDKNKTEIQKNPLNLFSTSIRFSNCQETPNKYECITRINNHGVVKTFTVRYKCCYGFKRQEGTTGCSKQVDLKPILQTLDDLNLKEFRQMIKNANLDEQISNINVTILAPTDAALEDYNEKMVQMNNVEGQRKKRAVSNNLSSRDLALSHTVDGFVDLTELSNEDIINSEHNNSSIRINYYPTQTYKRLITLNCARVNKINNLAENGIVHIMDGVVLPATQTIRQIIEEHPQLTNLRQVLQNSDIYGHMKQNGHYTIFAPTDEAFNKLDESQKQKILNGGGCATSILKHHITAHTICSAAIIGNATTHNVEGDTLNMERTADDNLIFETKAKIVETDIIATDGVIHLIDTLILPDSALDVANIIKAQNFTKFQELIEKSGLQDEFNNLNNVTVFVPSDEAFEKPNNKKLLEEIGDDVSKLQELVRYHTVKGQIESCNFNNNEKLQTNDNEKELRVNLYSTLPLFSNVVNRATINCARISDFDEKACGSVVHEVNNLLQPPMKNLYELLQDDPKYTTLREVMAGTEVEQILQENNRSITFLAPTDETFAAVEEDFKQDLLKDKKRANEILKNHILTDVLCCSGVGPRAWGFNNVIPTMFNQHVEVGRVGSKVRINRATVTSCDNLATNGVLHNINKILVPQRPVSTFGGSFFLFDL